MNRYFLTPLIDRKGLFAVNSSLSCWIAGCCTCDIEYGALGPLSMKTVGSVKQSAAVLDINKHTHSDFQTYKCSSVCLLARNNGRWSVNMMLHIPSPFRVYSPWIRLSLSIYTFPRNVLVFWIVLLNPTANIYFCRLLNPFTLQMFERGKSLPSQSGAVLTNAVLDEFMVCRAEGVKAQPVAWINLSPAHLNLERKTINSAFVWLASIFHSPGSLSVLLSQQ